MPRRRRRSDYPRVVYGPYGARMTIHRAEDWPKGWTTQPEGGETHYKAPDSPPYSRAELKRRLREANIPFNERAADSALWEALKAHG